MMSEVAKLIDPEFKGALNVDDFNQTAAYRVSWEDNFPGGCGRGEQSGNPLAAAN